MLLSDLSVKRPVFATVINLLLITFGIIALKNLPLRGYPDIDPPVVSIETHYPGASAEVVENKLTLPLEDQLSGIDGLDSITASSNDGISKISIEFNLQRDIDAAANDVREAVSRVLDKLPEEAKAPEITKSDANATVIVWYTLSSPKMNSLELSDYANRYLIDRFKNVDGVARVLVSGERKYVMKISLNRRAMAAREITANDVEDALRAENVEIPAGNIRSNDREFTLRLARNYRTEQDFRGLVLKMGKDSHLVNLGEIAEVQLAAKDDESMFRGNGKNLVGIGIVKQAKANSLQVVKDTNKVFAQINQSLPDGMLLETMYDTTVFVDGAVKEVLKTLVITMLLVIAVIYLFVGSWRATLIPALSVPVSLIAAFIFVDAAGFSINLLTLLALMLGIGLVVDDSIVVLENIYSRVERGEPPLLAAYRGTREVGFAVIATTLILLAVFIPIVFIEGTTGKLFTEFALTLSAAVLVSGVVALSLTPMLCSKLLRNSKEGQVGIMQGFIDRTFGIVEGYYRETVRKSLPVSLLFVVVLLLSLIVIVLFLKITPKEFDPGEDRGAFLLFVTGPEGATFESTRKSMEEIEQHVLPKIGGEDIKALMMGIPGFGQTTHNTGAGIVILQPWEERDNDAWQIMRETMMSLGDIADVQVYPWMRKALVQGSNSPVEFVIGGDSYEELAGWRDTIALRLKDNPKIMGVRFDYTETLPQLNIHIDRVRAADMGVSVSNIGRTLETMLGSREATTFIDRGEEYDVLIEGDTKEFTTRYDLENIYVRSDRTYKLIPLSNLVNVEEHAGATTLNRYNRMRALTLTANLADDYSLGEALDYLNQVVKEELPESAHTDYKGISLIFMNSTSSVIFVFFIAILIAYLVLAAQFESFIHPLVVLITAPLALLGALIGIHVAGVTLNVYSQIGIIMLIGLAAKNGILIVEFANQMRDAGMEFSDAIVQAATKRLRPIVMTSFTTIMGAVPLLLASGPGAESRMVIGVVIFSGVICSTLFTLFIIPAAYYLMARNTRSPQQLSKKLAALESGSL